jgi:translation initiation factor 2 subunit 2
MGKEVSSYEALLERGYEALPETLKEHSRFVKPEIHAFIQGKITVVQNLGEVSKAINREPEMLAKHLAKEFGTSGTSDGQHLILKGQFRPSQIQEKFEAFLDQYVLCPECGRPDTRIIKEDRFSFLKCEACGSRRTLSVQKMAPAKEKEAKLEVGQEFTVDVTGTGKKGDGMAKMGKYIIFIANARAGQRVKAKITGIQGNILFAIATEILT